MHPVAQVCTTLGLPGLVVIKCARQENIGEGDVSRWTRLPRSGEEASLWTRPGDSAETLVKTVNSFLLGQMGRLFPFGVFFPLYYCNCDHGQKNASILIKGQELSITSVLFWGLEPIKNWPNFRC